MRKKFFLLIIVCLVMGAGVMAQTSTVSGTVFAEDNNEPIIGDRKSTRLNSSHLA